MKTVLILQTRLDSKRLPGKALLPIRGIPLCQHAMNALRLVRADEYVLATDPSSAEALRPLAGESGFALFEGPKEDVLSRYCQAARQFKADRVIRATGDNPLVSYELANLLVERRAGHPADYSGYLDMPTGMGVEVVEAKALYVAEECAQESFEREHVCPFIYRHPETFRIDQCRAPAQFLLPGSRVTVDTQADFDSVADIFGALYGGRPLKALDVIAYLKQRGTR
jgi:spore coat polysaccharide biosynthesis protein SpsF